MEENPEIDPHKYAQLAFDKGVKAIKQRKHCLLHKWYWSKGTSMGGKKKKTKASELREKHRRKTSGSKVRERLLRPKAWSIKAKVDILDLIKITNFGSAKDPLKRIKMQAIEWEKLFTNHIFDKGLGFRI